MRAAGSTSTQDASPHVAQLESLIAMLYDVEEQIKGFDDGERLARRQSLSRHILARIQQTLASEELRLPEALPQKLVRGGGRVCSSSLGVAASVHRRRQHSARQQRL